jgi:hypothetical protein
VVIFLTEWLSPVSGLSVEGLMREGCLGIVIALIVSLLLLRYVGCTRHASFSPDQTTNGGVTFDDTFDCPEPGQGASVDWGDGVTGDFGSHGPNFHTYAFNGSYKVTVNCADSIWPFNHEYVTRANINTARDKPSSGLSWPSLSGLAALITAIASFLTFLYGKKQGEKKDKVP